MTERASEPISPIGHRTPSEREALVRQWTPIVQSLARRYQARLARWHEFDDLLNEGRIALWDASEKYDGSLGLASFKTYAYRAVQHRFEALAHYWRAKRRRDSIKSESMDESYDSGDPYLQIASGDLSAEEHLQVRHDRQVINEALDSIGAREQQVIEARFVHGHLLEDIAKDHGVSRERIRQIEQRALDKLQCRLRRDFPGRAQPRQGPLSCRESVPLTQERLARRLKNQAWRQKVASRKGSA